MKQLVVAALVWSLGACAGSPAWTSMQISSTREEADVNNANLMKVQIGHTKNELVNIMGVPAKREAYSLPNEKIIEFLFYRTGGWSRDVATDTDAQYTPVAIEDGRVTGWGRNYYDRVVKAAVAITVK